MNTFKLVLFPLLTNWDLWFSGWHVNNYLPDGTHKAMTLLLVNLITSSFIAITNPVTVGRFCFSHCVNLLNYCFFSKT